MEQVLNLALPISILSTQARQVPFFAGIGTLLTQCVFALEQKTPLRQGSRGRAVPSFRTRRYVQDERYFAIEHMDVRREASM